ncbi:pyridoxamine 5'-phosphate oxidase family protein [Maribacter sp. 2304DJ31-5]|uniref:pyridoxamine 5'-phosphate oxidase family protein n=1 Tax=Maribacter sp. 2304DJ31-5 TaxID=3386273 RepID=UPI0039BC7A6D
MTPVFWQELNKELQKSVVEKGHPFRYFTLATTGMDNLARLRTVVLRYVSKDLKLIFYTDKRSKKITHIKENNKVSLLFFHPKKLLQLKIEGKAHIIADENLLKKYWHEVQPNNRKDYTTTIAPGNAINDPDHVTYLNDKNYFCMIEIQPFKIEYLKLKKTDHVRIRFSNEKNKWNGEFLVP